MAAAFVLMCVCWSRDASCEEQVQRLLNASMSHQIPTGLSSLLGE